MTKIKKRVGIIVLFLTLLLSIVGVSVTESIKVFAEVGTDRILI